MSSALEYRLYYPFAPVEAVNAQDLWAYIGTAVQVVGTNAPPRDAIADAPPNAAAGQRTYYNRITGKWAVGVDIAVVNLEHHKQLLLTQLDRRFNLNAASLSTGYTEAERYTWQFQEADALAYQRTQQPTALLQQLAAANSYTIEILCQRILYKAQVYRDTYAQLLARYQAEQNRIRAAFTTDELRKLTLADLTH